MRGYLSFEALADRQWLGSSRIRRCIFLFIIIACISVADAYAQRVTVSLNGSWQIEDSTSATEVPRSFTHTVQVPGLVHLSVPAFENVDEFDSIELIANRVRSGKLPESARSDRGIPHQNRNYFWYRKVFTVQGRTAVAILRINKAQFGTAVWLNGKKIGEYAGCFSAGYFDLSSAMNWNGENVLLVRVGAHPGVLPVTYPTGTDFEKLKWTPGIYDDVTLMLSNNPVIENVQVAPRIQNSEILVETRIRNSGGAATFNLTQRISTWKDRNQVARSDQKRIALAAGEEKVITQTISIPDAILWSPENPFLYILETGTGGDSATTRFGMREFRFDTSTRRAFLNGKVYFLRGSNITFHRFLEDPKSGALPWDEKWVRKLLVDIPKRMHWNSFRFCIGPVPDKWLDIADEAGLLIQNEFFMWTGAPSWDRKYHREWDVPETVRQYGDWMRDNWNHPSVAIWDANNETEDPVFGREIIPAVRGLDLSGRPWENSYNLPAGPDDPVEDHPYLLQGTASGSGRPFRMTELENSTGFQKMTTVSDPAHAGILNEYGWLWVNRDGTPTLLTEKLYEKLLGPNATNEERLEEDSYLLGAETEFWRAHRSYAGVLHFVYLTCSYPGVYTSDHFQDVEKLRLIPQFEDYLGEAFKPLGVYLNYWQPALAAGAGRQYRVMMINDYDRVMKGRLVLTFESVDGREAARTSCDFSLQPAGQQSYDLKLDAPISAGKYLLKAAATADGVEGRTLSRRKVTITGGDGGNK